MRMEESKKMGRPTKYKEEYDDIAFDLCTQGYTNDSLSSHFGVSYSTYRDWLLKHESFRTAVQLGKSKADQKVVDSIFRLATQQEPDIRAAKLWLRIRNNREFGDKSYTEFDFKTTGSFKEQGIEIYKQASEGKITIDEAVRLTTNLTNLAKLHEATELEERMQEVEKVIGVMPPAMNKNRMI